MGRARHLARREGQRGRPPAQGRPHFLVFSTNPNAPAVVAASPPPTQRSGGEPTSVVAAGPTSSFIAFGEGSAQLIAPAASIQSGWVSSPGSGSSGGVTQPGSSSNNRTSSPSNQDRAGPSDFQSFSESLKSRFSAMSTRYKESITKSTRGWKERFLGIILQWIMVLNLGTQLVPILLLYHA